MDSETVMKDCETCDGAGVVARIAGESPAHMGGVSPIYIYRDCPDCDGTGIEYEPDEPDPPTTKGD